MEKGGAIGSSNSSGICAVVFGILSLIFAGVLFGSPAGIVLGVLGLIFSIVQLRKSKNRWAYSGLVLSIIGIILNVIVLYLLIQFLSQFFAELQALQAQAGGVANAAV